jgi:hypothetical protein
LKIKILTNFFSFWLFSLFNQRRVIFDENFFFKLLRSCFDLPLDRSFVLLHRINNFFVVNEAWLAVWLGVVNANIVYNFSDFLSLGCFSDSLRLMEAKGV